MPSIGDAYATAVEYRARVTKTGTADDTTIDAQLLAASRLLDRECGRHFTKDAAAVARVYDTQAGAQPPRLSRDGMALEVDDIASLTGLIVKVDLNGDYDYADADETLVINTHFWIAPANAALEAEARPWTRLELVPDNTVLGTWPQQRRAVQVTALFGWPALPGAIKEAAVMLVRELRDLEEAGMTLGLQNIDQVVNLSPQAFSVVQRIKAEYGREAVLV